MIKKIELQNFMVHRSKAVTFTNGINLILGNNQTGKSSLLEAVTFALFAKTKNSHMQNLINYDSKQAVVSVELIEKAGEANVSPVPVKKRRGRPIKVKE